MALPFTAPQLNLPRFRVSAGLLGLSIVVFSFVLVRFGALKRPELAVVPLPAALVIGLVRRYTKVTAGLLPAISLIFDGSLNYFHINAPIRVGTVIVGLLLWAVLVSERSFNGQAGFVAGWIVMLLVANYVTLALPKGIRLDVRLIALLLEGFVVCAVVATLRPSATLVLSSVLASGLFLSVLAFFPENDAGRPVAAGLEPNGLGLLMAAGVVAAGILYRTTHRKVLLLAIVPMLGGLMQTQSRGATITMTAGLFGVLTLSSELRRSFIALGAGVAIAGALALSGYKPGFGPFTNRRLDTEQSTAVREEIYKLNIAALESEPIFGVGLGGTSDIALRSGRFATGAVSHNEYLRFGAEGGLPALAALLLLIVSPIAVGIVTKKRRSTVALLWPVGAAVIMGQLTMNALDNAQTATVIMTVVGAAWGGVADLTDRPSKRRLAPAN